MNTRALKSALIVMAISAATLAAIYRIGALRRIVMGAPPVQKKAA